jgi:ribosomal protein S18 acetylase RimI-like enzyme
MGAETARLVTVSSNTPAIWLYQGMGFQEAEILEMAAYEKTITPWCEVD